MNNEHQTYPADNEQNDIIIYRSNLIFTKLHIIKSLPIISKRRMRTTKYPINI